ncbi:MULTISPECIES: ABC transporter substrate-binding protein [Dehalococcoides]|uniref:ABC transporter substrate-binding protein n=1 Tax=Dehalococcoides TaxID=61434 RepID=UPI0002B76ED3|nr:MULTISPECIES: ABC transporter substrate-binding protein [Dehalococcoides]AGG06938.1 5-6 amino acyl oligopeptide transporter AppA [Dehalococcoides mccartyi DCMB5]
MIKNWKKFKKVWLIGLAAVISLSLFAGCEQTTPNADDTATAVTLKVGSTKPFKTTNRFSDYWYGVLTNLTTHDSLIRLGDDMSIKPWLAKSWIVSDDAKTFVFTIVDNAYWHDGTKLTAEDVAFSVEYYRDYIASASWMKDVIADVSFSGDTVTLSLSRPYGNLLTEFMTYSIVPKHIWQDVTDPLKYNQTDMTVGSGPFVFESFDLSSGKFIFKANKDYFQGNPTIDRLEVDIYQNMDALVLSLAKGDIDTWWDYSGTFPYTSIPALIKSGKVDFETSTYLGVPSALGFNLEDGPASDINVRKAIAAAINYQQIIEYFYAGYGSVPTTGFVPPTHPNFNADLPSLAYNPAEANALLDAAGLLDTDGDGIREDSSGQNIFLRLLARSDQSTNMRLAEILRDALSEIGLGVEIRALDLSAWASVKDALDYDMVLFGATPWGTLMHAGHGSGYFDSRRTGQGVLHNLAAAEYLAACDARLATADPAQQAVLDLRIQELTAEYLPGIALAWTESVYPYRQGWSGWVIDSIYGGVFNGFSFLSVQSP